MAETLRHLQEDLFRLERQRLAYLRAAKVGRDRTVVLRHLLNAERLEEEIAALRDALEALGTLREEGTSPTLLSEREGTDAIVLGRRE